MAEDLEEMLLHDENAHQPTFSLDEWLDFTSFDKENKLRKESYFLYPENRNDEILNTAPQPRCFEWVNYKQCFTNIAIDITANRLELRPVTPWQLLFDDTFQEFLETNSKNIILVARLGYEICFGIVEDLLDLDEKLRLWFNHHIYDTTIIVDVHDFKEDKERRIRTFVVRIAPNGKESQLMWKKSYLEDLKKNHE